MSIVEFFSQPVWHRLSFTLVHFVWQGLAVALIACAAVRLLKLQRGTPRYAAYLVAFVAMAACPLITFAVLDAPSRPVATSANPQLQVKSEATVVSTQSFAPAQSQNEDAMTAAFMRQVSFRERLDGVLQASLPWAMLCWMGGVLILSVRLLLGFLGVRQWRRNAEPLTSELTARIGTLSGRLGMPGFSRVFISQRAMEAVALGYLRPVVLLPAALVTRMPPEMLEAVIAHELAHIRRLDLWVNLAQRVVETLLFYHPAVWWLSNRLRAERELCCDELAVKTTGERVAYASALEQASRARLIIRPPALATEFRQDRKPTLSRVRHVLGLPPAPSDSRSWLAGVIAVALLVIFAIPTVSALTAAGSTANAEESEHPRFAARTFNSDVELAVDVQTSPRSDLVFESTYWAVETERIGRTPSAAPLEIPVCQIWWVHPSNSVRDWDLLAREIGQKQIPGLQLSDAMDSDLSHLTGLTKLQGLVLHRGQVTDEGLAYLKNLTGLQWLDLSETGITDTGLVQLQDLRGLQGLNLSKTQITGAGLKYLEGLTQLQCLYLSDGAITNVDMEHLKGLIALRRLNLHETPITDAGLAHIEGLTGLRALDLSTTRVTGSALAHLQGMTRLQELVLCGSMVADQPLQHLGNLTSLQVLDLSLTRVRDADLAHVENLTHLRRLDLSHTWITDAGLTHLKGLTGLQHLCLRNNAITNAGAEHLKGLTQLQRLDLSQTKITDAALENLKDLAKLRELTLSETGVTGEGLGYLKGLTQLQRLDLSQTKITGAGLEHLRDLAKLEQLSLRGSRIMDAGLAYLEGMTRLQILDLTDTQITDAGLAHIKGLAGLEGVGLSSGRFTDQGLEQLKSLPNLKQVNFDGRPRAWPALVPTEGVDKEPAIHEANLPLVLPAPLSQFPLALNGWTGEDMEIPTTVREYMRANFADDFISRRYTDKTTRQSADLYVVYCTTHPTGILGHKPQVCYPRNGWPWDSTTRFTFTTQSGRKIECLLHSFHKSASASQRIYVLHFYVLNGMIATSEEEFANLLNRTVNQTRDPARYIAQVQVASFQKDSIRSAATAMADAILDSLPDPDGRLRAMQSGEPRLMRRADGSSQSVDEISANDDESKQLRFAARTFNSDVAFDVFVRETPGSIFDQGYLGSPPRRIGRTPRAAPLEIPACSIWWVEPLGPVTDWEHFVREMNRNKVPALRLPRITDSEARHLANLTELEHLDLSYTQITNAGLPPLTALPNLQGLGMFGTKITDAGMVNIRDLVGLRELILSRTGITDKGLADLKDLTRLRRLDSSVTWVTDAALTYLEGMVGLEYLDLSNTQITDAGMVHLKGLVELQHLLLQGAPITDAGLQHLKNLTELRRIEIAQAPITDGGLIHLQGLTQLQILLLVDTKVTGPGLQYLKGMTDLQGLILSNSPITDAGLEHLRDFTGLRQLYLSNSKITDAGMAHLTGLTGLQQLELSHTAITNAGLEHLKDLSELRYLDLRGTRITDAGLAHLKGLSGLQHVNLADTQTTQRAQQRLK